MILYSFIKILNKVHQAFSLFAYALIFLPCFVHGSFAAANTTQRAEYKVIDNLVVNNKNDYKTVIYKNENVGVSEIKVLVESSRTEEAWVYLPDIEKWIEVGLNEESEKKVIGGYITKTRLDVSLLNILMDENNIMVLYHFHPPSFRLLEDEIIERKEEGLPMSGREIEILRTCILIKSTYPSRSDLMSMIGNSTEFYERNPEGKITFKVCSHYGITEYHLTDEGLIHLYADNSLEQISKIKDKSLSANVEANETGELLELYRSQARNPLKRIKMSPKQKRQSLSRYVIIEPLTRINKALSSMNDVYIDVSFTPYQ